MKFVTIPVTPYQQNCTLMWDESSGLGALVDPGGDVPRLLAAIATHKVTLQKIILTHGHLDHVGGTAELMETFKVPVEGPHPDDQFWLDSLQQQAGWMGFKPVNAFTPTRWLYEGDTVSVGNQLLNVLHCPGHTPGHVVLFSPADKIALVGDVLFAGSVGRSDFPRGDHDTLVNSIREKLWPLGDDITFLPGHGPRSTFGHERRTNPFVADQRFG